MKVMATACLLARFDTRQIGSRLPPGLRTAQAFFGAKVHRTFATPSSPHGRRALRTRQSVAPRFPDECVMHSVPCPTAFGLMDNGPKNAAPQRFQIGPGQNARSGGRRTSSGDAGLQQAMVVDHHYLGQKLGAVLLANAVMRAAGCGE